MKFESFIAQRYLKRRFKTTLICILGLCLGVLALIVVRAVFTGFQSKLKETMVSVHPHLRIEKWGGMPRARSEIARLRGLDIPSLETVSRYVAAEAVLKSQSAATGVIVKGLDAANEDLGIYEANVVGGKFDLSDQVKTKTKRRLFFFEKEVVRTMGSIILGDSLARMLHAYVGDTVTLIAPTFEARANPLALDQVETRQFVVRGIFHLGMNEFDASYALVSLDQAQGLFRLGERVNGVSLRFASVDQALEWKWRLQGEFGKQYVVTSWQDVNPTFFQAVKVEKSVQTIFLALIVFVAAFNIFSTLIMMVMEKTKDIGILRAVGARAVSVRRIFLMQGLQIGVYGVCLGTAGGLLLLRYRNEILDFIKKNTGFELFPSDVYLFDGLPAQVHTGDVLVIAFFGVLAALVAAYYPAHRAATLHPVEALRYE